MMHQTLTEIRHQLTEVDIAIGHTIETLSPEQLFAITTDEWSAADYARHLILSVTPVSKAMRLPADKLVALFGTPEHTSRTPDQLKIVYTTALVGGVRAQIAPKTLPEEIPLTEDDDGKQQLLDTWHETHERLLQQLDQWDDSELDDHQLPHPALGNLTLREMLYFTIAHNQMHHADMQRVAAAYASEA